MAVWTQPERLAPGVLEPEHSSHTPDRRSVSTLSRRRARRRASACAHSRSKEVINGESGRGSNQWKAGGRLCAHSCGCASGRLAGVQREDRDAGRPAGVVGLQRARGEAHSGPERGSRSLQLSRTAPARRRSRGEAAGAQSEAIAGSGLAPLVRLVGGGSRVVGRRRRSRSRGPVSTRAGAKAFAEASGRRCDAGIRGDFARPPVALRLLPPRRLHGAGRVQGVVGRRDVRC